jgi:excisionase family DNA binding protein
MTINFSNDKACYSVNDVLKILSLSRTTLYKLVARGELSPMKIGRKTLFSAADISTLLTKLQREADAKRVGRAA